jgi:hypothetical protein
MNKGKNHKKSLLTCFKAVVAVDDDDDNVKPQRRRKRNGTTDPVLAYLAAADEDGVVLFSTAAKEECGSRRRKRGRDTWHALRMAFNDTSLVSCLSPFLNFGFSFIFSIFSLLYSSTCHNLQH